MLFQVRHTRGGPFRRNRIFSFSHFATLFFRGRLPVVPAFAPEKRQQTISRLWVVRDEVFQNQLAAHAWANEVGVDFFANFFNLSI